jgi:hypothetical protein
MSVSTSASVTGKSQRIALPTAHRAFTDGFYELRIVRKHPNERKGIGVLVRGHEGHELARSALDELSPLGRRKPFDAGQKLVDANGGQAETLP